MAYLALGAVYSLINPLFESPDEPWHFEYVRYLTREGRLPVYEGKILPMRQEASQPPLYYALASIATGWIDTFDIDRVVRPNPHASIGRADTPGNRNAFTHHADRVLSYPGTVLAAHLARGLSVLLGAGVVLCTYAAARDLFPERPELAWAAAAVNAFTPGFLFISASINNDILAALAASAVLALLARGQRFGWTRARLVLVGAAIGVAALAKLNALGVVPLAAFVLAMSGPSGEALDGRHRMLWLLKAGAIAGGTAALLAGWWYLRNWQLYGDPLGNRVHFDVMAPPATAPTMLELGSMFTAIFKSWWGVFGWFNVVYPQWVYTLLAAITLIGLAGYLLAWGRGRRLAAPAMPLLWAGLFLAELVGWSLFIRGSQGRLMFPAVSAVSIILARGLAAWMPPRWSRAGLLVLCGTLALLAAATPWAVIAPAYAVRPPLTSEEAVALPRAHQVRYGDSVELVSRRVPAQARPGDEVPVALAWSLLETIRKDYSVFVQVLDRQFNPWATHDTYPQNGAWPTSAMTPGAVYADPHTLRLPADMPWCNCYLVAGLYDFETQARPPLTIDGRPAEALVLGDLLVMDETAPDSVVLTPSAIFGEALRLTRVVLGPSPARAGGHLNVALFWQAAAAVPGDYTAFVHLTAPDGYLLAQHDGVPAAGTRPTASWAVGETVIDVHAVELPAGLADSEVRVRVGLYDPVTGERLRGDVGDVVILATVKVN